LIPIHNHDGVLPPFTPGGSPTELGDMSPYRVDLLEVVQKFGITEERREILGGLLAYRNALRSVGISSGFQWIDGSFVEDCERVRGRPPKDIDIITFSVRPAELAEPKTWRDFVKSRPDLFDPETSRAI